MVTLKHLFLLEERKKERAVYKLYYFINHYQLVSYDQFLVLEDQIINGTDPSFWSLLKEGLEKNKLILANLLSELEEEGFKTLKDLKDLPQGYLSKSFHTVAHFLDGFFGIDSYFYNLVEDSHWVSPSLKKALNLKPKDYYLLPCEGIINEPERKFETLMPRSFLNKP